MFGARALAIPVQYGQSMQITEYSHQNKIIWIAREMENVWFTAVYSAQTLELEYCSDLVIGFRLQKILLETKKMNPLFIRENSGYHIDNHINFNRSWGLGTSSTLLANIANWASVNPFLLHQRVSQGS